MGEAFVLALWADVNEQTPTLFTRIILGQVNPHLVLPKSHGSTATTKDYAHAQHQQHRVGTKVS